MKKLLFVILALILLSSMLTGMLTACSKSTSTSTATTSPAGKPKMGGTLTVAEPIFPGGPLGYPPEAGFAEPIFQQPALEPLLLETADGTFSGLLATKWTVATDGSSITFTLRQGVKFHDGSTLDANVVKWNFDLQIPTGKPSNIDWASVDAVDANTVRVNLKKYTNSTLAQFAMGGGNFVVSKAAFDKNGKAWSEANMVGTGPFMQTGYQRDTQVEYAKFADYWRKDDQGNKMPYLDKLVYKCIADPMTAIAALKSGELDGEASGADKNLADLVSAGLVAVTGTLGVGGYFPSSSDASSPLSKEKVREALEYAIDKDAIAKAFSYNFWGPAYQYAPPSSAAYDSSLAQKKFDQTKAKQLLSDAGYPNGIEFDFNVTNDDPAKSISEAIVNQWAEIGIKADIKILESAKFQELGNSGWSGLLYGAPTGPSNWHSTLKGVIDPDKKSYVSVDIPQQYIDLWNAAAKSVLYDPAKEKAVVDYVTNNEMVIPVWNVVRAWVVQSYVKGGGFLKDASAFFWWPGTVWLDK
jgi:ABC-type transport system substrate-binding protein